jgi:hypothetical protein
LDRTGIEKIPYEDFGTLISKFVGPSIDLTNEGSNWYPLLKQKRCNESSGRALLTTGCTRNQY